MTLLRTIGIGFVLFTAACRSATPAATTPDLRDAQVRKLAGGMGFTEGPVWIEDQGVLVFSDIPEGKLMRWSEERGLEVHAEAAPPNGNLLDLEGRLLTCQHGDRNLVRHERDGSRTVLASHHDGKRLNSPNDLTLHSDGTLWFTDPPWGLKRQTEGKEQPGNHVYRLDPDGTITAVLTDLAMPNGIALAIDQRTLYVADTGALPRLTGGAATPARVLAYRIRADKELEPEPLWEIETRCDGMCLDARGNLYTTGAKVNVFRPDGTPIGSLAVPETPANVCFGGPGNRTLFITARTSLYAAELEVEGFVRR